MYVYMYMYTYTYVYMYMYVYMCVYMHMYTYVYMYVKGKGLPQQAEVAQRVQGRLRPRISLTFSTTRVVGRQPYAPAAFTPGEIPGTHF